jgi:hypothetical protein
MMLKGFFCRLSPTLTIDNFFILYYFREIAK